MDKATDKIEPTLKPREFPLFHSQMTLRDYFAGQAMVGILSNTNLTNYLGTDEGQIGPRPSEIAYDVADAMMEARKEDHENSK